MRALILGGTRFIGWHIASRLNKEGYNVTLFHRGSTPLEELSGVEEILGDRADLPRFRGKLRQLRPDVVIDCIGYTAADGIRIVETFRGWLERMVFLSSCDVYRAQAILVRAAAEPLESTPLHEGSPLRTSYFPYRDAATGPGDWRYDYDKIPIERILLTEPAFQTTVLRLSAIYGPRDYQRRVWEYLRKMDAGRKSIVISESMNNWRWSRAYVENIASAVAHLLQHDAPCVGRFNLSDPAILSEKDWIQQIGKVAGWDGEIVTIPDDQLPPALQLPYNFGQDWTVAGDRFRIRTGFSEPVALEESLRRTVDWHRANRPELSPEELTRYQQEEEAEDQCLRRISSSRARI
jgi:nucleoside-diphosphate-sugar epimerase